MDVILIIIVILALSFLGEAATVWVLCWAVKKIGVTTIAGWTVAFSWPLALIVWIISLFLHSLFRSTKSK